MRLRKNPAISFIVLAVVLGSVVVVAARYADETPRSERWKKVDEAVNKGLPKTAISELEPIIESAKKDKAYPEAVKAIARKISLEGQIQGSKPAEQIVRMKAEMAKAPKEMLPTMEAIMAQWYWHYFQGQRWQFMNRTATAAPPGDDFTTWDLPRIFAEIDKHFTAALANDKVLKAIPITDFDALLTKGSAPDAYRPTLYDFLANEALTFYMSPEQAGAKAEDAFEIEASSAAFGSATDFLNWKPVTTDADSPKLKAIKLFQALMEFHKADKDQSAFLDLDIHRLNYAKNIAVGEEKNARYKVAMKAIAESHADHPLSASARAGWAQTVYAENDFVLARTIALQGANAFPKSVGGTECHNLIQQIEAKQLTITTEAIWTDPLPIIRLNYRNITKVYFRVYHADWTQRMGGVNRWRPEQLGNGEAKAFLAKDPSAQYTSELPSTDDYHSRIQDVPVPKDLKPGFYFIFASPKEDFSEGDNVVQTTSFWVSDLAVVIRNSHVDTKFDGFVLRAKSGEPIASAKLRVWDRNQNNGFNERKELFSTDKNGFFTIPAIANQQRRNGTIVLVSHEGQQLAVADDLYANNYYQPGQPFGQTVLFTDRSLYRPGQTIQYKGIALQVDQEKDNYKTKAGINLTIGFYDPNNKEVAKADVRTNDYGSFSGSFTAPRDRLAGQMSIRVITPNGPAGMCSFNVEEYKRPKFLVTIDAPKDGVKLNGEVKMVGKAIGYTGSPINNAKVRYRVTREVRYPSWWYNCYWWRMPPNQGAAQEIAHGTATTEVDGIFTVTFTAKPDATVAEKDEPTFHFNVSADVTDTTGETRSGDKTTAVGYTALQAAITIPNWLLADKDFKIAIQTTSIDGEGQAAKGTVKVHKLVAPEKVTRPDLLDKGTVTPRPLGRRGGGRIGIPPGQEPKPDPSDPRAWALGEVISKQDFTTEKTGKTELPAKLPLGYYRVIVDTQDAFGKPVTAQTTIRVMNPENRTLGLKVPHLFDSPKWTLEPGEEFQALWGTGYETGRAYVEVEHRRKVLQSFWTDPEKTQITVKQAITEAMRGGFTVRVTFVKENRIYTESRHVDVPWSNKDLQVKWERHVNKLEPGAKETYTAVITGPKAVKAAAEMVAAMYDASLDAYLPHHWMQKFNFFRQDYSSLQIQFQNRAQGLNYVLGQWKQDYRSASWGYRHFPYEITAQVWFHQFNRRGYAMPGGPGGGGIGGFGGGGFAGAPAPNAAGERGMMGEGLRTLDSTALGTDAKLDKGAANEFGLQGGKDKANDGGAGGPGPDLSKVSARTNLNETAFFFPHLAASPDGTVRMTFTMPEALTKWKFMGFAHDNEARSGYLESEVVTAKDLMVQPNPPRFLREGDILEFTVKVSNQSPKAQVGRVKLNLTDLRSGKEVDAALGNAANERTFDVPAGESRSFSWKLNVPDGQGALSYKAVGGTDKLSDGEEGFVPVLSKRILVTESMPLPIRGAQTKDFNFTKLIESAKSNTLKHQSFSVQMTSQPAWYAVLALPYLMEYPHECAEQTFNRYYANALAKHIANSDPKIRKVFDQWKNTPALDSPLEKNGDLKAVTIEETPWLRDANKESEARRNVGILFDQNRLDNETDRILAKLKELQREDGAWPWFPGGPTNEYITLYITTGIGRLRNLGVKVDPALVAKSVTHLDAWATVWYQNILKHSKDKNDNHMSSIAAMYLYGRSFFLKDVPVAKEHQVAVDYWQSQAKKYWLKMPRQNQAQIALGLKRFGDRVTPADIIKSIKEFSVSNEEMGMFWRDTEQAYWWYHAPIETQAMMIEALDEVSNDGKAVEDCKVWLLKTKQTTNWKTTKATADAVYALLLRGNNLLSSDALVEVKIGGEKIKPENVEAGTGFYEQKFVRGEVKADFGKVTVTKTDPGVSWGSVHWQYLEDVAKVTPHEGTPLKLEKSLFTKTYTKQGPKLEAVKGPVAVGDELVVRVVLRTDRDMEYIHMKDQRGSGTEPVNVLSRYKFQDGFGYYESTKDTATHFFIDYLPKGTYVFEYSVRVQHKGTYPSGLASIQCMYAPEFNSHSGSVSIEAK